MPDEPGRLVRVRGGGIGPGLPGSLGAQLARPDRKVVGICSDGAAMYSISALWTAAHHRIPVTYVMLNNAAYRILKLNMVEYLGKAARGRGFTAMDLTDPELRFDRMAESMGVPGFRVDKPEDLAPNSEEGARPRRSLAGRRRHGEPGPDSMTGPTPRAENQVPILSVRDVTVRFGGIIALERVSFDVEPRQIVGLIGPNGAGKTTLFNCLSRLYTASAGTVTFEGDLLLTQAAHKIVGLGIGRTFQNLALFPTQSVLQNVMVGAHCRTSSDFSLERAQARLGRPRGGRKPARAEELLDFLDLRRVADHPAAGLPFATLKRVELARALASRPKLLLLDEPAGGLNHEEVGALGGLIQKIRGERGLTILLVEHHMSLVMQVSDKVVVLDFGRKIAEGTPRRCSATPR